MHFSLSSQNRDMLGCEYGVHGLVAQAEGRGTKHQQPLLLQGGHCSLPAMKWVGLWLRINWSLSGGWFQFWVTSCWVQSPNLLSPSDLFLPRYSTNRQIFGILRFRINSNVFTFYRHLKMLITTFCDWECYLLFFFLTFLAYRLGNFKSPCERGQGSPGGVGLHGLPMCSMPCELLGSGGVMHCQAGFAATPKVCRQPFPLTSANVWGMAALGDSWLMIRFEEKMLLTLHRENCLKKSWNWSTSTVLSESFIRKTSFPPRIAILKNHFNQELHDLLSIRKHYFGLKCLSISIYFFFFF